MTADQVKVSYPVDALVSYHYYAKDEAMTPLVETGRLRLIGDSGAFSAMTQGAAIKLGDYAEWVRRWQDHLFWAASLDVIGDPAATQANWRTLRDKHGIDTVPTVHAGTPVKWLDPYAKEGVTLVGLGGMAGTGQAPRAFRWAIAMFRHARDNWPGVRFHLWGVTNRQFLDALPAWSADSSGILGAAYRYAQLRIFDPGSGKHHNVALRGDKTVHKLGPLLRRTYGVDPAAIETSHPGNRTILIRLAAASTQQYAAWLQRRHKVTCPAGLSAKLAGEAGTRIHMVAGGNQPPDLNAVTGPRLHLVSAGAGGKTDDLDTVVTGTTARTPGGAAHVPRLRLTDAAAGKLAATVTDSARERELGPALHLADTYPNHLLYTTKDRGSTS